MTNEITRLTPTVETNCYFIADIISLDMTKRTAMLLNHRVVSCSHPLP